jgi:hypothetical protein
VRRLLAVAVLSVLVAAACHSSTSNGVHWRQNQASQERRVQVWMSPTTAASNSNFRAAVEHGIAVWDKNAYVDFFLTVDSSGCAPGAHCVDIRRAPMNGERTTWGWDADLHMFGNAAHIVFDSAPWDAAVLRNATCHGLGHALGLSHSTHDTPGPCQGGVPTGWDMALIDQDYGHSDGGLSTFSATEGSGSTVAHDTEAELERGARGRRP